MPAIDFPSSPTVGQLYQFAALTWCWNGYGWLLLPFGGYVGQDSVVNFYTYTAESGMMPESSTINYI